MDHAGQYQPEKSPAQRRAQADIALKLEPLFGVIPVFHLEYLLHHHADDVFEHGRRRHARQIAPHRMALQRQRNVQQDDRAEAVNGQHGPAQKAAVDPAALFYRNHSGLKAPAEHAVQVEHQQPLRRGIAVSHGRIPHFRIDNPIILSNFLTFDKGNVIIKVYSYERGRNAQC